MYSGTDPLPVDRVRGIVGSERVERAVRRGGQRGWKRPRRRFPVRMVSSSEGAERRRRVSGGGGGGGARAVESGRRREQRMRMRVGEEGRRGGRRRRRVIATGQAGVAAKMLEKLVRGGEPFPAVGIASDPIANVRPAPGQRGRVGERRGGHGAERR